MIIKILFFFRHDQSAAAKTNRLLVFQTGSYIFSLQVAQWNGCLSGPVRWVRLAALLNEFLCGTKHCVTRRPVCGGRRAVAGLQTMPLLTALVNLTDLWSAARAPSQTLRIWFMAGERVWDQDSGMTANSILLRHSRSIQVFLGRGSCDRSCQPPSSPSFDSSGDKVLVEGIQ